MITFNLLKSTLDAHKSVQMWQINESIKWCVVFADGTHKFLYKIITEQGYLYLAMNTETYQYEPVYYFQNAYDAYEAEHGPAIWAQAQTVEQWMQDKWGNQ